VSLRFVDWIWQIRGSLALAPGLSSDEAFDRLAPLFLQTGTSHQRTNDTLVFSKTGQAAQDKMSVFDGGALRIEKDGARPVLRYRLTSRALLACFLAPVLFLSIAQLTIAIKKYEKQPPVAAKKHAAIPMNPIDKALGAPAPDKSKKKGDDGDSGDNGKKLSPKAAYIFAEIFAVFYIIGRVLEDRQVKALFRKHLLSGV
jgi:hypothetical protein